MSKTKENIQQIYDVRNVLREQPKYLIDLQLFGKGKSGGKLLGSLLVGALTAAFAGVGVLSGLAASSTSFAAGFANFMLGASLFSSIWTATHQDSVNTDSLDISRFDRAAEQMSSTAQLQVVYGRRLVTGNQTFHETDADAQTLHKHVILCEGGIEGIESVTANDLLLPTGSMSKGTVFTIRNVKYSDAKVGIEGRYFKLYWSGKEQKSIYLCNKKDTNGSYWSYQMSVTSLLTYVNSLGEGWQAFPVAATSKLPGELDHVSLSNCYNRDITFTCGTVTGGTKYVYHDGDTPSNYENCGAYPKMVWLDLTFTTQSEFSGNPTISCVIKGKKVYDTRTKTTAYSTNPAMCLRDFILSKRYGLGKWFDEDMLDTDSWEEAADYCDETITFLDGSGAYVTAKRYELNMIIDQQRTGLEWVQNILANFAGFLVYSDGKLKLRIEKQSSVVYKFDDTNCYDLKVSPLKLSETPNRYEVTITDPLNNWTSIKALCEDFADQKLRQRIVTKEVSLEGVTSQNQALRLARFYRDYNLVCPFQLSFTTGMQGMNLEPGDVVTVSYHDVFTEMPIRIAEIKETNAGTYEISGRQYNDTIYGDALGGGIHFYNYSGTGSLDGGDDTDDTKPDAPTNITAKVQYRTGADGGTSYDILVKYDLPEVASTETGLVYYKRDHATGEDIIFNEGVPADEAGYDLNWQYAGDSPTQFKITDAVLGDTYKIKVLTRSKSGQLSDDSTIAVCKVTAKATIPAQPQNLKYDFSEGFTFYWTDVADSDAIYYELRTDTTVGSAVGLLGRAQGYSLTVPTLSNREDKVYLYAVNSLGKASYPATITYSCPQPDAPSSITFTEVPIGCKLTIPSFPNTVHSAIFKIGGNNYSVSNTEYTYQGDAGVYPVQACYVDLFGEGYWSTEYQMTVKPTINEEWIASESISLDKVDQTIKDAVQQTKDSAADIIDINNSIGEINEDIVEINKTTDSISTKITDVETQTASQIQQTSDSLTSQINNLETDTASKIEQLDNAVNVTVANKTDELASQISAQADRITAVVTNLNDEDSTEYSAITQMKDDINLKVSKGDVVNQINVGEESITIDGKYLHITGTTSIDDNVIVGGMIAANSITADKLSSSLITLTGDQGIAGTATQLDADGLKVALSTGATITFGKFGMLFKNLNDQIFAEVGRFLIGTGSDGQHVTFGSEWDVPPTVMVATASCSVAASGYSTGSVWLDARASGVTTKGFDIVCKNIIKSGSSTTTAVSHTYSISPVCRMQCYTGKNNWQWWSSSDIGHADYTVTIPSTAQEITASFYGLPAYSTGDVINKDGGAFAYIDSNIDVIINGTTVGTYLTYKNSDQNNDGVASVYRNKNGNADQQWLYNQASGWNVFYAYKWSGADTCWKTSGDLSFTFSVSAGTTSITFRHRLSARAYIAIPSSTFLIWPSATKTASFQKISYSTASDQTISTGSVVWLATSTQQASYTVG